MCTGSPWGRKAHDRPRNLAVVATCLAECARFAERPSPRQVAPQLRSSERIAGSCGGAHSVEPLSDRSPPPRRAMPPTCTGAAPAQSPSWPLEWGGEDASGALLRVGFGGGRRLAGPVLPLKGSPFMVSADAGSGRSPVTSRLSSSLRALGQASGPVGLHPSSEPIRTNAARESANPRPRFRLRCRGRGEFARKA